MKRFSVLISLLLFVNSCTQQEKKKDHELLWKYEKTIKIEGVNPIGIVAVKDGFWISDGDHNRMVLIKPDGSILKEINGFDRPMHIDIKDDLLYVPEYGNDRISIVNSVKKENLSLQDSLDAPAGIAVFNEEKAIVDFYNHRILYTNGSEWISFGKEGKANGYFYFPTDVQITRNEIFIADAYNNRIQVFDKKGNFLRAIGSDQKMNAATGMYVSEEELIVTDFENNRILIFNLEGAVKQIINQDVHKPIDAVIANEKLYVNNFREQSISVFTRN